jgi:hypothetical protein
LPRSRQAVVAEKPAPPQAVNAEKRAPQQAIINEKPGPPQAVVAAKSLSTQDVGAANLRHCRYTGQQGNAGNNGTEEERANKEATVNTLD